MSNRSIFFILGAGASVDSGLFTYRGPRGMYTKSDIKPETLLTEDSFTKDPHQVWNFLKPQYEKLSKATPGPTYQKIADLCRKCPGSFVLTQNIDRLVTKAVDVPVVEIHGQYDQIQCTRCGKIHPYHTDKGIHCEQCGVICRPDIVFFKENLPMSKIEKLYSLMDTNPRYVVAIGTTLQFYYLQTLITEARVNGAKVIHINPDEKYASNVRPDEIWIKENSHEGLQALEALLD